MTQERTQMYTLSLHDALPIRREVEDPVGTKGREAAHLGLLPRLGRAAGGAGNADHPLPRPRSEEHTSELQSLRHLVCRLLLEQKKYYRFHDAEDNTSGYF